MTEPLLPLCEPVFLMWGSLFVAHVVPHEFGVPGCYEVTVHQLVRPGYLAYLWYGTYSRRLVSDDMPTLIRNAAERAVRGAVAGC